MKKSIYTKEYNYFTSQLKKARIEAGYTQVEVAKKLKRSQSNVSKEESGQIRLDVVQLKEYASLYKKDIGFFIKYQ
jgi:transcriptional regulator with XRE-family HTH domain